MRKRGACIACGDLEHGMIDDDHGCRQSPYCLNEVKLAHRRLLPARGYRAGS